MGASYIAKLIQVSQKHILKRFLSLFYHILTILSISVICVVFSFVTILCIIGILDKQISHLSVNFRQGQHNIETNSQFFYLTSFDLSNILLHSEHVNQNHVCVTLHNL